MIGFCKIAIVNLIIGFFVLEKFKNILNISELIFKNTV